MSQRAQSYRKEFLPEAELAHVPQSPTGSKGLQAYLQWVEADSLDIPLLSRQNEWMGNLCWLNALNNDASLVECVNQCLSFNLPKHLPYKPAVASPSGTSQSLRLCGDTAQCVLCRRVNEAQPRLPSSSSCFGYSSMSAYIPACITRKGGGRGFSWQRARLGEACWSRCPVASRLALGSSCPFARWTQPGSWPAASSAWDFCLAWETTAPSCPSQVWCYVNVVLFLRSHVGAVENGFPLA